MGIFKKKVDRKKFADTKVGKFLKEKGAAVLDVVDDFFPPAKILTALIEKDAKLTVADKAQALELLKLDIEADKEVTERWKADMQSDSWLSKNVRPLVLLYLLALLTVIIGASFWGKKIPEEYTSLLQILLITVFGAYFGGRTLEKGMSIRKK